MPTKTLILVRHAESEHHIRRLSGGWTDTPITEIGHRQAHLVAQRLKSELGDTPIRLFTSDLLRTRNTAQHIADAFEVEPIADGRLREFNNGEAAGLTIEEVHRRWPRPDFDFDGPLPIVVTHGGTLFVLVARWLGLPAELMKVVNFHAHVTSVTVLKRPERGLSEVERLNDVSHLAGMAGWVGLDRAVI
jgi:broad specificity phosphatase PhoE